MILRTNPCTGCTGRRRARGSLRVFSLCLVLPSSAVRRALCPHCPSCAVRARHACSVLSVCPWAQWPSDRSIERLLFSRLRMHTGLLHSAGRLLLCLFADLVYTLFVILTKPNVPSFLIVLFFCSLVPLFPGISSQLFRAVCALSCSCTLLFFFNNFFFYRLPGI